jgi:site-specific DNA-methyltransferase (adenine-specific)
MPDNNYFQAPAGAAYSLPVNQLYYGDNLHVLREHIASESVDLIYLDPPFNSKRDYNLLFKSPKGQSSQAQIEAFEDTWHWNEQAEREFDELLHQPNTDVAEMMKALRSFLGENDMMAYLTMMANRLLQLHRVLKPTGSLYLHCDPTASHYLKIVLDGIFGKENYISEIIWKRTAAHSAAKGWNGVHDTIFHFAKTPEYTWNKISLPHTEEYSGRYKNVDPDGRVWADDNLTGPGVRHGDSGAEWRGHNPTAKGSHWKISAKTVEELIGKEAADKLSTTEKLDVLDEHGLIHWPRGGSGFPRFKRMLSAGQTVQDLITDISPINSQAQERLGYPTQKPLALLERIIQASSNEGDVVLDPFCGCGTAVHAAQKLNRQWIGIDITHLAISLIEKRLKDAFKTGLQFEIHGTPKDLDAARDLARRDKYQFQWWAVSLVAAQPFQGRKKGADGGIDGLKFFRDLDKKDVRKIVVSVKGGENLKADDIRSLMAVREREGAEIGIFISLEEPTRGMVKDAASAGFYESPNGRKFPRVQLLTIGDLLEGKARAEHPDYEPDLNFKKAKQEEHGRQKELI